MLALDNLVRIIRGHLRTETPPKLGGFYRSLTLNLSDLDALIGTARRLNLLARIGVEVEREKLSLKLPCQAIEQMRAAQIMVSHRQRIIFWELNRLNRALIDFDYDVVLLKGSAYMLAGLRPTHGRLFADVDLFVAKKHLSEIEETLRKQYWDSTKVDDYDQHYYRAWMHEIPPMRHRDRTVEV